MTRRQLFARFLENGGRVHLSSNDQMIATSYAHGRSYNQIGTEWGRRGKSIKDQVNRIKYLIDRVNNQNARRAEEESLRGYRKFMEKPAAEIAIE